MAADPSAIATKLIKLVKQKEAGAEAQVVVYLGREQNTRFAAGEITTAGDTDVDGVVLTVALGARHATATSTETNTDRLAPLAERAVAMAKLAPEDPEWVPVLGPQKYAASANEYDEATATLGNDQRAKAAREIIALADEKKVIPAGFYFTRAVKRFLATSRGLSAEHRRTVASLTLTVRTPDGTGSGWAGAEEMRASSIDAGTVARTAVDKAIRSQSPKPLSAGEYTVVLEPMAVGDLMNFLLSSLDARGADEGRSFFSKAGGKTKVGDALIAKDLSIVSDPADPLTPGASSDDDGVPLSRVPWFEQGTLKALANSRYWAQKKKVPPTGNQRTFLLSGGKAANTEELIGKVKRGLLVTRFWYVRWLQPRELTVTGLTRDGVFLIENGKISHPVNNFRFNQSPLELLARCQAATTNTVRVPSWGGLVRVPAILSERFHMASVSAAV